MIFRKNITGLLSAFFAAVVFLFACKQKQDASVQEKKEEIKGETVLPFAISDSVISGCNPFMASAVKSIGTTGLFEPDSYPVEEELLRKNVFTAREVKYFQTADGAWFRNDTLGQVLIISVATDSYRSGLLNFSYKEFPGVLLTEIPIWLQDDKPVADSVLNKEKKTILPSFIDSAKQIPACYFTTLKGFNLGDCREKAFLVYGKPHESSRSGDIDILKWHFDGDFDGEKLPNGKLLLAKGTYGHTVTMYFRNNRLVALFILNDVP